ncbi:serine/arginine-rich splicing factor 1B-like isoform X1 [Clytia hemisphaerica]|uniref:RRM domain-containing protein n=1 Tax=Clytia hemisphaerica TaxID=252671 RepID=A0A7M5UP60_9CNID
MSSRMTRANNTESRIYVGNLPDDIRTRELEDVFSKFGRVADIEIKIPKSGRAPAFAFIQYEDPRDADDAIRAKDGSNFDGQTLRVELPSPKGSSRRGGYDGGRGGGRMGGGGYSGRPPMSGGRGGRGAPPQRSDYRIMISGLPTSGSWQDIKDHCRDAGEVVYADVFRDGTGIVEFARRSDMEWAVDNLDDTSFRSHEGESSRVRFRVDGNARGRSRSRSPRRGGDRGDRGDRGGDRGDRGGDRGDRGGDRGDRGGYYR